MKSLIFYAFHIITENVMHTFDYFTDALFCGQYICEIVAW